MLLAITDSLIHEKIVKTEANKCLSSRCSLSLYNNRHNYANFYVV
jgi:hypothetical protein